MSLALTNQSHYRINHRYTPPDILNRWMATALNPSTNLTNRSWDTWVAGICLATSINISHRFGRKAPTDSTLTPKSGRFAGRIGQLLLLLFRGLFCCLVGGIRLGWWRLFALWLIQGCCLRGWGCEGSILSLDYWVRLWKGEVVVLKNGVKDKAELAWSLYTPKYFLFDWNEKRNKHFKHPKKNLYSIFITQHFSWLDFYPE